jgi:DDE superfamily endonuclease
MLRRSPLFARIENDAPTMFSPDAHIIGDPAYPLRKNLLVAFKNNRRLTRREERYNKSLSAARSVIERAFSHLKGRFRRLKYLDMTRIERIPFVIMACCVLHNVCLNKCDELHDMETDTDDEPCEDGCGNDFVSRADDHKEGARKRERIADMLQPAAREQ